MDIISKIIFDGRNEEVEEIRGKVENICGFFGDGVKLISIEEAAQHAERINAEGTIIKATPQLIQDIWNGYFRQDECFAACDDEINILLNKVLQDGDVVKIADNLWFRVHEINGLQYYIDAAVREIGKNLVWLMIWQLTNTFIKITVNDKNIFELIDY